MKKAIFLILILLFLLTLCPLTGFSKVERNTADDSVANEFVQSKEESTRANKNDSLEDHVFQKIKIAYLNRDIAMFNVWYSFFQKSFINSVYQDELKRMKDSFFYKENLDLNLLHNTSVALKNVEAKDWDDLQAKLIQLHKNGVTTIRVPILQQYHFKLFSFLPKGNTGYFMPIKHFPLYRNILGKIINIAHQAGLKVYVTLPLRNHIFSSIFAKTYRDSSWNPITRTYIINNKVDLYHTDIMEFFRPILSALAREKIDGVVLSSDFAYEPQEGFSHMARYRFLLDTGSNLIDKAGIKVVFSKKHLGRYYVPPQKGDKVFITMQSSFFHVAQWRSRELKQFLWDFVAMFREYMPLMPLGLEVVPSMVDTKKATIRWATGVQYFWDLKVDFFQLNNGRTSLGLPTNDITFSSYIKAAQELRRIIPKEKYIFLTLPLTKQTKNPVILNQKLRNIYTLRNSVMPKKAIARSQTLVDKWIHQPTKTKSKETKTFPQLEFDIISSRNDINLKQLGVN